MLAVGLGFIGEVLLVLLLGFFVVFVFFLTKGSCFGKGGKNLKPNYTNSAIMSSMNQTATVTQIT